MQKSNNGFDNPTVIAEIVLVDVKTLLPFLLAGLNFG